MVHGAVAATMYCNQPCLLHQHLGIVVFFALSANVKYSALRRVALQTLDKITAKLVSSGQLASLPVSTASSLRDGLATATDPQSKTLAATVLQRLGST